MIVKNGLKENAKNIWRKDKKRLDVCRAKGIKVFLVWETGYRNDPASTVEALYQKIKRIEQTE